MHKTYEFLYSYLVNTGFNLVELLVYTGDCIIRVHLFSPQFSTQETAVANSPCT